jgi:cysteinyl-tRNA synthetase
MLMTHYRKPMDWTASKASDAQSTLRKWHSLDRPDLPAGQPRADIVKALSNDLNTSLVLTLLTQWADTLRKRSHDSVQAQEVADFFASARLIGLLDDTTSMGAWVSAGAVTDHSYDADLNILGDRLRDLRIEAMQTKNFNAVDDLKAELIAAGIEVRMSKAGVDLMPADGFDPVKLKGLM